MPAIPLHTAVSYVAGAYLVFFALILVYVVIMATKLGRIETELSELTDLAIDARDTRLAAAADPAKPDPAKPDPPKADPAKPNPPKADAPKTGAVAR